MTRSLFISIHRTVKIQPVLHELKEYGYIEVAPDKMVTITTLVSTTLIGILDKVNATYPAI
jgi:hypothetical protein